MESKQKYKVFINDQPVLFTDEDGICAVNCIRLRSDSGLPEQISGSKPGTTACVVSRDNAGTWNRFIASYPVIQAAGGFVKTLTEDTRYLMIFRLGKWDLPKGKIDPGEKPETAAVREVEEECGISGMSISKRLPDTWHMYKHKGSWVLKQTFWYEMEYAGSTALVPQTEEGIEEARWVTSGEMAWLLPDAYASIRELLSGLIRIR